MKKWNRDYWQVAGLVLLVISSCFCFSLFKWFGEGKIVSALSIWLGLVILTLGKLAFVMCEPAVAVWDICFGKAGWGLVSVERNILRRLKPSAIHGD